MINSAYVKNKSKSWQKQMGTKTISKPQECQECTILKI